MAIKTIFILIFIIILLSLGTALFQLVRHKDVSHSKKTAKALSYRIGLSLVLFIALFITYATGYIKPEGIGRNMQIAKQSAQNRLYEESFTTPSKQQK